MSFGANHGALPTHGSPAKIYGSTEKNMTVRWEGGQMSLGIHNWAQTTAYPKKSVKNSLHKLNKA